MIGIAPGGFVRSIDNGASWDPLPAGAPPSVPSAVAYSDNSVVYVIESGAYLIDLNAAGSPTLLSTGRVLAVAARSGLVVVLEVADDGLRLDLAAEDGTRSSTMIEPPGPTPSASLSGAVALLVDRVVVSLGDPAQAEEIVVSVARLN
ncbi:MAG: hypothetical protein HY264_00905 [Chloroflexi bacterium]|nr:hypothetical protein [Chloroflexota bacterium]